MEGGRLIGKGFLRATRAKQGLKEVIGLNWYRGAGGEFRMEGRA